ncbi:hypothetical protein ACIB24_15790 [Spongisporangium articulatum]|uniref:Uncharacterized protein n=1 Tax=Spongisporangium articulatum TaxID=3362603 RepID=A0ABW8ASG5_9ACTN
MSTPERPGLFDRLFRWRRGRDELMLSDLEDDAVYYQDPCS